MKPSISRDVHIKILDRCVAAKITDVYEDGTVALFLFPPPDLALSPCVRGAEEGNEETQWHWPERVE